MPAKTGLYETAPHQRPSTRTNCPTARARWLIPSFTTPNAAYVTSNPSGTKIGSYPNPETPEATRAILPSARPKYVRVRPSTSATHSAQTNQARHSPAASQAAIIRANAPA